MLFKTLIFFCFAGASFAYRSYENYKVYNVVPTSEIHIQMLGDLKKAGYDFWTDILTIGGNARVMVAPEQEQEFVNYAHSVGLKPNVTISNVQA